MTEQTDNFNQRLQRVGLSTADADKEFNFWGTKESDLLSYERSFGLILNGKTIPELLAHCQKPRIVVDLFSYGFATRGIEDVKTLSVALTQSPLLEGQGHKHLAGDLEDPFTWVNMRNNLREMSPQVGNASGIISRQLRGDVATFNTLDSTNRLIKRVHGLLDYRGFALLQVPQLSSDMYLNWVEKLKSRGMLASYQQESKSSGLVEAIYFQNNFEFEVLPSLGK